MYRLWPSAKIVSNAKEDFPEPEIPVKMIILFRGSSSETFFRLCSLAPLMMILSCIKKETAPAFTLRGT
jgi:hypothetical protein